jgi:hypothetical protein
VFGRLVAVLCLAAVAAGCGGTRQAQTPPAKTPAGFTLRVVAEPKFAIAVPASWRALDARQALSSARTKAFAEANPELSAEVATLARPNSPIKLLAVDPRGGKGFATSLNVLQTQLPSKLSFEKWSAAELAQLKLVRSISGIHTSETQLSPGRALQLTYRARIRRQRGSFQAVIRQYLVKHDDFLYVLTYTTLPETVARDRAIFDMSARTFRLG